MLPSGRARHPSAETSAATMNAPPPPWAPSPQSTKRKPTGYLHQQSRKTRKALTMMGILSVVTVLVALVVISYVNADDPDVLKNQDKLTADDWKALLEKKAKQSAPPHEALGLSQVVFVSCNRHDRGQAYWGYVAAASQCEMLPADIRAKSAPCRRLYAGRSPIITTASRGQVRRNSSTSHLVVSSTDVVPLGACGSVVDSANALAYRVAPKSSYWKSVIRGAWRLLRRTQVLYPAAHVQHGEKKPGELLTPPPVDALLWLGDAIYADKPANGKSSQGFGHVMNSLEDVKKMWVTQRDAPMYDAFRESCIWRERATLPARATAANATDSGDEDNPLWWPVDYVVGLGQRIGELFEVADEGNLPSDHAASAVAYLQGRQVRASALTSEEGAEEEGEQGFVESAPQSVLEVDEKEDNEDAQAQNEMGPHADDDNPNEDEDQEGSLVKGNNGLLMNGVLGAADDDPDEHAENDGPPGYDNEDDEDEGLPYFIEPGVVAEYAQDLFNGLVGDGEDLDEDDQEANLARKHLMADSVDENDGQDELIQRVFGEGDEDLDEDARADALDGRMVDDDNDDEEDDDNDDDETSDANMPENPEKPRALLRRTVASAGGRANVYGTWDDHDMGKNDGGKEYAHKNVTKQFFLDFLKAPKSDPRWEREGVYAFHTADFHEIFMGHDLTSAAAFGGNTSKDALISKMQALVPLALAQVYEHALCMVLLDVRSFRDAPTADHTGDMLGEAQWRWLEERIVHDIKRDDSGREKCALTLVGGGIQLIADEKTAENWAAFPRSRDRLFALFKMHEIERVAFLTGDVHMGELAADFTQRTIDHVMGYPIIEATSSGLTHSAAVFPGVPTLLRMLFPSPERRIGRIYIEKNFGSVRLSLNGAEAMEQTDDMAAALAALKEAVIDASPNKEAKARARLQRILDSVVNATFTIYSIPKKGKPVLRLNFPLGMLTYEGSQRYVGASVLPQRGYVYPTIASGPVMNTEMATEKDPLPSEEFFEVTTYFPPGKRSIPRYPNNRAPLFTAYIRWMQAHFFRTKSISKTIGALIRIHIKGAIILTVVLVVVFWRKLKKWCTARHRGRNGFVVAPHHYMSTTSPSVKDDSTTVVSFANYVLGKDEKQKEG